MGTLSKALSMLGPICLGISVGLELFSLFVKLYNGDFLNPKPSEFDQTMLAIKTVGQQVDNMAKKLDFLFEKLFNVIEFNVVKEKLIDIIEVLKYADEQQSNLA